MLDFLFVTPPGLVGYIGSVKADLVDVVTRHRGGEEQEGGGGGETLKGGRGGGWQSVKRKGREGKLQY